MEPLAPEKFRLFIALPLPVAVMDEIEKAQSELRRALPKECVRWTKRAQFHLTLRFLGNVEAGQLDALNAALRDAVQKFSPLPLRAERIGFFPDLRFPRVIWAWVHDRQEVLPKLQSAIESAVARFTVEAAEEKFTGHVTLGRCQKIRRPQAEILARLAHAMTDRFFGEWTANCVELIRSELAPGGSRYTTLASVPLGTGEDLNRE